MRDGMPTQIELALLARKRQVKNDAFTEEVNWRGAEIADEIDHEIAFVEDLLRNLRIERQRFTSFKPLPQQAAGQSTPPRNFPKEQPPRIVAKTAAAE
jgi:hypothetical protein